MKSFLSERVALRGLIAILSFTVLFHLLVILTVIPFEIVWGGRLKNRSQMLGFETVSIAINLIMLAVVAIKANLLKVTINRKLINGALWFMSGLFFLNTIGNLFSANGFEKMVFTPLTLLLSLFNLRAASGDTEKLPIKPLSRNQ